MFGSKSSGGRSARLCFLAAMVTTVVIAAAYGNDALDHVLHRHMCGATVHKSVPSPDGAFTALVFERSCGFGSDSHTKVALLARGDVFDEIEYPEFLTIYDDNVFDLPLVWTGPAALSITLPPGARTHYDAGKTSGVQITLGEPEATGDSSRLAQ